jgi:phosphate transport system protein
VIITVREIYQKTLENLKNDVLKMGNLVTESLNNSVLALTNLNREMAREVVERDKIIDNLELDIETKSLKLIALQQPTAGDLRTIIACIKVIIDLERIGDYAVEIADRSKEVLGPLIKPLIDIPRMSALTQEMINDCLEDFKTNKINKIKTLQNKENQVDALFDQIYRELLSFMIEDPKKITAATQLLYISRMMERAGDHACNIGESVIYMISGQRTKIS